MKPGIFSRRDPILAITVAAVLVVMTDSAVQADWTIDSPPILEHSAQDIVITLKLHPMANPEAACLSVTFARGLKGGGASVTLLTTLDGVALGDGRVVSSPMFKCKLPSGLLVSLKESLEAFLASNPNNMLVCPPAGRKGIEIRSSTMDYSLLRGW